jgi:hypothetical protein
MLARSILGQGYGHDARDYRNKLAMDNFGREANNIDMRTVEHFRIGHTKNPGALSLKFTSISPFITVIWN